MTDMTKAIQPQDQQRELLLTQDAHDRTLYELPGVGQLRVGGYFGGTGANIIVDGATWQCRSVGWMARKVVAVDAANQIALQYSASIFRPTAGTIAWAGRELRFATVGRGTFQLTQGSKVLATFSGLKDSRTPVRVTLDDRLPPSMAEGGFPPLLLMFATYLARDRQRRAVRTAATAGGGTSGSSGAGCSSGCSTGCGGGSSGCGGSGGCGGGGCGGGS
jgi:hypothetical protein